MCPTRDQTCNLAYGDDILTNQSYPSRAATDFYKCKKSYIIIVSGKLVLLAINEYIENKTILLNYGLILLLGTVVEPKAYSLFLKIGF